MDEWKRSGQIPAFGNWDMANELPITQYFECARQAGLLRYSSSSGESGDRDLYAPDWNKHVPVPNSNRNSNNNNTIPYSTVRHKQGTRNRERRCPKVSVVMVKENENVNVVMTRKQGKVYDVTEQPRKPMRISKQMKQHDAVPSSSPPRRPKPVDEDLYKIPPELLHTTKRVSCTCCLRFMSTAPVLLRRSGILHPNEFILSGKHCSCVA